MAGGPQVDDVSRSTPSSITGLSHVENARQGDNSQTMTIAADHGVSFQSSPTTTGKTEETLFSPPPTLTEKQSSASTDESPTSWFKVPEWPVLRRTNANGRPWRTTFIRLGPLSGLFSMLLAIASIVASLGILIGSDGHDVQTWQAPPATYLAILTSIANLCVRYACIQGMYVSHL